MNVGDWFRFDYHNRTRYGCIVSVNRNVVTMEAYNADGVGEGFKSFAVEKMGDIRKMEN